MVNVMVIVKDMLNGCVVNLDKCNCSKCIDERYNLLNKKDIVKRLLGL